MHLNRRHALAALIALCAFGLLPARAALAADDLEKVLARLDASSANFHALQADFVYDTETKDPVPDSEIQKGTVYYQRNGTALKMAAHIDEDDHHPVVKTYTYSGGLLALYDNTNGNNQVTRITKAGAYEGYLLLGFGASGKDMKQKWDMKYLGSETIDGVKTEKLEMVAKDAGVRKNISKVTIWVDPERAISLKQRFDLSNGSYRLGTYKNLRMTQSFPASDFTFKTDGKTTYINQ